MSKVFGLLIAHCAFWDKNPPAGSRSQCAVHKPWGLPMNQPRKLNMTLVRNVLAGYLLIVLAARAVAQPLPEFDFTRAKTSREWGNPRDISELRPTTAGLEITIQGEDPYFFGPARDYPAGTLLWLVVRLKTGQAGTGEVFYFRERVEPEQAVKFSVPASGWTEARVPLPALGANYRLRLDPPGTGGKVLLAAIRFERRVSLPAPSWPAWTPPGPAGHRVLSAGALELFSGAKTPFAIELRADGQSVAFGHPRPRIGYLHGSELHWVDLSDASVERARSGEQALAITVRR